MIIYNVTINVEESAHNEWLDYMKNEHISDVMNTGCFIDYTFSRIITRQEGETGITYAIQYKCKTMGEYDNYQTNFASALQKEHTKKFEGKFYAFRTLLEEVE